MSSSTKHKQTISPGNSSGNRDDSSTNGEIVTTTNVRVSTMAPIPPLTKWAANKVHELIVAHQMGRLNNPDIDKMQNFIAQTLHPTIEAMLGAKSSLQHLTNGAWKEASNETFEKALLEIVGNFETTPQRVKNFGGVIDRGSSEGPDAMAIATYQSELNSSLNQRGELDIMNADDMKTSLRFVLEVFSKYCPPLHDELRQQVQDKKIKTLKDLFRAALKEAMDWQEADAKRKKYLFTVRTDANTHCAGQIIDVNTNQTIFSEKLLDKRATCFGCGREGHKREVCHFSSHPDFNATGNYPYPEVLNFKRKRDGTLLDSPIKIPESPHHGSKNGKKSKYGP